MACQYVFNLYFSYHEYVKTKNITVKMDSYESENFPNLKLINTFQDTSKKQTYTELILEGEKASDTAS